MADHLLNPESDSDRNITQICDTCLLDRVVSSAVGYCKTCPEYLCDKCMKYHCKPRKMRNHCVVEKEDMPKRRVSYEALETKCECGDEKNRVNFYCKNHQKLLCVNCISRNHSRCVFKSISDVAKCNSDYQDFLQELNDSEEEFKEQKDIAKKHREKCHSSFDQVFKEIRYFRHLLEEKLSHISKVEKDCIEKKENYSNKMQTIEKENEKAVSIVHEDTEDLKTLENVKEEEQLFVVLQRSKQTVRELKEKMKNINKDNVLQMYRFVPCDIMKNILEVFDETGKITETCSPEALHSESESSITEYAEFNLPKCVALSESCVAVIDKIHNTLRMVENGCTIAQIKLSSCPWDIAKVSKTKVAVTHPRQRKVSIVKFKPEDKSLNADEIDVRCRCEGIAYGKEKIYIASTEPPCVVVLDIKKSNEESKIFNKEKFEQPAYIDVHPAKDLICVSDRKSDKVFILKGTGEIMKEFECRDMKMPLAVAFRDESVVAIGFESNTINKIFYEGPRVNVVETKFLHDVAIIKVFNDPAIETDPSWKYCACKYFTLVCKNSM